MKVILCMVMYVCLMYAQKERWVYTYNGTANQDDQANAVVVGIDDNIYTAGYSSGSGTARDLTVISLTSSGSQRWVYTYNGPVNGNDVATALAYGSDGNLYIAGTSMGVNSNDDIIVISLDTVGGERWVYRYNGTGNADDNANAITCGLDNNLYIAGGSYGTDNNLDFTIISLDTGGSERWVYRYDGGVMNSWHEEANDVSYGMDNNIYAAGYTWDWINTQGFAVISIDTAGLFRWHFKYGNIAPEEAQSIVCGLDTNIYAAGCRIFNYTLVCFDTLGSVGWSYNHEGTLPLSAKAQSVIYGIDYNVYSAGHWDSVAVILSLSHNGDSNWVYLYSGPGIGENDFYDIVQGPEQTVFAAGWSPGDGTGDDVLVAAVETSGTERWVYRYNGGADSEDRAYSLAYGLDNNLYVAGYTTTDGSGMDFTIISLDTTTTSITEHIQDIAPTGNMYVIPNPFMDHTEIRWQMPDIFNCQEQSDVTIKIYDVTGCLTRSFRIAPYTLHNTLQWYGDDDFGQPLSAGVYFVTFQVGGYTATEKVLLLR